MKRNLAVLLALFGITLCISGCFGPGPGPELIQPLSIPLDIDLEISNGSTIKNPQMLTQNDQGIIAVADTGGHQIVCLTSSGNITSITGSFGVDTGQLVSPNAVVFGLDNAIVVGQSGIYMVKQFQLDGSENQFGGKGAGNGEFLDISGVLCLANKHILVSDSVRGQIQEFNASGIYQGTWGTGLLQPMDMTVTPSGNVVVADAGKGQLMVFDIAGHLVNAVCPAGTFSKPGGICSMPDNSVLLLDKTTNKVSQWTINGQKTNEWKLPDSIADPVDILYISKNHTLWVTDNHTKKIVSLKLNLN